MYRYITPLPGCCLNKTILLQDVIRFLYRQDTDLQRSCMQTLKTMDLSEISLIEKKERCLVTVDIDKDTPFDKQVEMIIEETKKYQLRRLHDASYGTMIAAESLRQGNYEDYSRLFIEIPFPIKKKGLHIQPAGRYLRAFYQESPANAIACYQKIFEFSGENGFVLSGFSYEVIINENVISRTEDAVVQIEIPIKKNIAKG